LKPANYQPAAAQFSFGDKNPKNSPVFDAASFVNVLLLDRVLNSPIGNETDGQAFTHALGGLTGKPLRSALEKHYPIETIQNYRLV